VKAPHRARVQAAVAILSELVKNIDEVDRAKAVELLKKVYQEKKISPIRGRAQPVDIFDKELATLYVVGKYGLKLDQESPELFEKVFYVEQTLEEALKDILESRLEEAREKIKRVSPTGTIDSNMVARLLRIPLTMLILGFMSEEEFRNILHSVKAAISEEERTVTNYARFFIGFKLAEAIYKGEVKSREEKEALKKALAIRIGFPKSTPSDDYVEAIATSVFNINRKILEKVLSPRRSEQPEGEKPACKL
jgi:hypothetical protein